LEIKLPGSYQDKDGDGLVAWYPDPAMEKETPPAGQDPASIESLVDDEPKQGTNTQEPIKFAEAEPYASVSSVGEATAEFTTAFTNMFGASAPKELATAYTKELQALQASRTNKKVGKNKNIVIQGVSPQERLNILNKYLTSYATSITGQFAG